MRARSLALSLLLSLTPVPAAQDAYTVIPQEQTTIYESGWLRVRRVSYPPGKSVPLHEHKARVVVFLRDAIVRSITPDGKITDTIYKAGTVNWSEPVKHSLKNLGSTPLEAVEAELLGRHPDTAQPFTGDPGKQDPAHFKLEFENDRVRVFRYMLGPGEFSPTHDHLDHVAVRLTDAHWGSTQPDGSAREFTEKAGDVSYRPSNRHTAKNLGDAPIISISIEFKNLN
jgi:predicted metal-dependent enzyme (double-stranded beta helix superfamily)